MTVNIFPWQNVSSSLVVRNKERQIIIPAPYYTIHTYRVQKVYNLDRLCVHAKLDKPQF